MNPTTRALVDAALEGRLPSAAEAMSLAEETDLDGLMAASCSLRDAGFGQIVTYSRKVFIPLTHLCRDVCHYCTFATTPRHLEQAYLPIERVLDIARQGAAAGCREALFTLGEKPELRYRAAREALEAMGFETTIDYLEYAAKRVFEETGLLPHLNPGTMTPEEIERLRAGRRAWGCWGAARAAGRRDRAKEEG